MTTRTRGKAPPMHTYRVRWEITTRANFELQGHTIVKATCSTKALAHVRERIGFKYAIPDEAVEIPGIEIVGIPVR